jgi:hypothetical protein
MKAMVEEKCDLDKISLGIYLSCQLEENLMVANWFLRRS